MSIEEFQKLYLTKEEKIQALYKMTNNEVMEIINSTKNIQAKNFYSKFLNR